MLDSLEIRNGELGRLGESGVTVFVRSVYLQGLFFKDISKLSGALTAASPLAQLREIADECGIGMAELAMAYMRGASGVDSLVLGCDSPAQLRESVAILDTPPLPHKIREKIEAVAESTPPLVIRPWEWNR